MSRFRKLSHAIWHCQYHLVWVPKYRARILGAEEKQYLKKVFKEIARVTSPGGYCLIWDNLRLAVFSPLLSLIGRAMGMNSSQRRLWVRAIRSSYTIGEVKAILRDSAFKGASVMFIPQILSLGIEWRKS